MSVAWGGSGSNVKLTWFMLGWLAVFFVKYVVVGLDAWNAVFHPGLIIAPNQEPYRKPFLGIGQS